MDLVRGDVLQEPTTAAARVSVNAPIKHFSNEGLWVCFLQLHAWQECWDILMSSGFFNLWPYFQGVPSSNNLDLPPVSFFSTYKGAMFLMVGRRSSSYRLLGLYRQKRLYCLPNWPWFVPVCREPCHDRRCILVLLCWIYSPWSGHVYFQNGEGPKQVLLITLFTTCQKDSCVTSSGAHVHGSNSVRTLDLLCEMSSH